MCVRAHRACCVVAKFATDEIAPEIVALCNDTTAVNQKEMSHQRPVAMQCSSEGCVCKLRTVVQRRAGKLACTWPAREFDTALEDSKKKNILCHVGPF